MDTAVVSVIIPAYNRAAMTCRAVDSVLGQTYAHCVSMVIDDGSTDGTEQVIKDRYGGNERVRYVRKTNGGVSAARNLGLSLADGDYIAYLDSDDVWKPWKIELQLAVFRKLPGVGMVWTNMDAVDSSGAVTEAHCMRNSYDCYRLFPDDQLFAASKLLCELVPQVQDPAAKTKVFWGDVFSFMAMGNLCQPSTVMLTRDRAMRAGRFDESMVSGEDHDYHLRACRDGESALIDIAAVAYRKGAEDQLTRPEYQLLIAQNFLRTIAPVIRNERHRLKFPQALLNRRLADAHAWIAGQSMDHGDHVQARRHYLLSLRHDFWQPRLVPYFAAACAPASATAALRRSYRRVKKLL